MLYGNAIYSVGAILIAASAQVRSYKFMIFATIIQALGDIATQVAQYKMFSSWFAPSNGFASTVGFELGIGKIGQFIGQATANVIAENLGDFAWVYWMAVFMNLFTNVATYVFYRFNKWSEKRYGNMSDPATGEKLTEKNKKFEFKKMLELPWPFWLVIAFSLFETSTAIVFTANATELAQQRFNISAVTAGWYSAMSQYMGFFLVPLLGLFIDVLGHRLTVMLVCGTGVLIASKSPRVQKTCPYSLDNESDNEIQCALPRLARPPAVLLLPLACTPSLSLWARPSSLTVFARPCGTRRCLVLPSKQRPLESKFAVPQTLADEN